jgi:hypothetical protein
MALRTRKPLFGTTKNSEGDACSQGRPCEVPEGFTKLKLSAADNAVFSNCGATGTITFFKGSLREAQTHLKARFFELLAKNPWLAGKLRLDEGQPVILYPTTMSEEHMHQLWIVDTDAGYLGPNMPIADLCRKVLPVHCCRRMVHLWGLCRDGQLVICHHQTPVVAVFTVVGGLHHVKVWNACALGRNSARAVMECMRRRQSMSCRTGRLQWTTPLPLLLG